MKKRVLKWGNFILVSIFLGLILSDTANAVDFDISNDDFDVSYSDANTVTPYSSVVRLVGKSRCSGTVVGKDYVLTASHCINADKSVDVYTKTGEKEASFSIDKSQSYYNKRSNSNGDYALLKVNTALYNGKEVHIGEIRKPLTILGASTAPDMAMANKKAALFGFPKKAGNHRLVQKKLSIFSADGSIIRANFHGGGGGMSGGPLLNSEGQILAVYHGSSIGGTQGYKASGAVVNLPNLLNNTGIRNETSRIYIWENKDNHEKNKWKINPEGIFLEKNNNALINRKELFEKASEAVAPGYHVTSLTNGVWTYPEFSSTDLRMPIGGLELYPEKIEKNDYSLIFDKNADTAAGSMPNQTHKYDETKPISKNEFTRVGYTFVGWNTRPDGTGTAYTDSQSVTNLTTESGGIVTLYAQWTTNNYHVHYDANTGSGNMPDQTFAYTVEQPLTMTAFTKIGYTFTGWNTVSDGSGQAYTDEQLVTNLVTEFGGTVTLYAQWTANNYHVHYDANTGSGTMPDQTFTYNVTQHLTSTAFTKTGHTFAGWNTRADGTGTAYTDEQLVMNLTTIPDDTTILYAQWVANTETATVEYSDDTTGRTLFTKNLTGAYGTTESYRTATTIASYEAAGYELVSDNYPANGVTYTETTQKFKVQLKHISSSESEIKTVKETIHYIYADRSIAANDYVGTISFMRTKTKDLVTGVSTSSEWLPIEGDRTFVTVTSPKITGYTADKTQINERVITPETTDIEETVTYTANKETMTVTYIDDTTNEAIAAETVRELTTNPITLTGQYGTTDHYQTTATISALVAKGYVLVSTNYPENGTTYSENDQAYEIHLRHELTTTEEMKNVTETIHYVYSHGDKAFDAFTTSLSFVRNVTIDRVTGATAYDSWTPSSGQFAAIDSPVISGYTPDKAVIAAVTNITGENKDILETVTYTKDPTSDKDEESSTETTDSLPSTDKLPKTGEKESFFLLGLGLTMVGMVSYLVNKRKEQR